ncbi:PDR/VanB family oxidoreductase [Serratia aquatilis]|uniref:PDR/VanB family oxidoreductase n=1 Tax=Serratia aquatilis TaxID=1737515 RepID=A0ABV6E968_9GAMM
MLLLRVVDRELRGNVVLLTLSRPEGGELPPFEAGAHLDLHLGNGLVRPYSLCSDPADCYRYQLGILKAPQSQGGSLAAHALQPGDLVQVGEPRNLFALDDKASHSLLIGGGIGITPMLAMAATLLASGSSFTLHYCARTRQQAAFAEALQRSPYANRVQLYFSDERRLVLAPILTDVPQNTHVYVCGPARLMDEVNQQASRLGYRREQIHQEYFAAEVATQGAAFDVTIASSGQRVHVKPDQSIAEALAQAGLKVCLSCKQGICGSCLTDVLAGEPDHRDSYLTDEEKAANDLILLCCSRAKGSHLVLDL